MTAAAHAKESSSFQVKTTQPQSSDEAGHQAATALSGGSTGTTGNTGGEQHVEKYHPSNVELVQVQLVHRHGERTPIKPWIQTHVNPVWTQCHVTSAFVLNIDVHASFEAFQLQELHSTDPTKKNQHSEDHPGVESSGSVAAVKDALLEVNLPGQEGELSSLRFVSKQNLQSVGAIQKHVEQLETMPEKNPIALPVPGQCFFGQLTDKIGVGLRNLYIDRLKVLPSRFTDEETAKVLYLRSTDYPRTVESLQHLLGGLYPTYMRDSPNPPIIRTRWHDEETMYGSSGCTRWTTMLHDFKEAYKLREKVKIDRMKAKYQHYLDDQSKPSLHSLFDTFIAMKAHGLPLPKDVSDQDLQDLERHAASLWFHLYTNNIEAPRLFIGRLLGEIHDRMEQARAAPADSVKMAIYSGHDTTLGPILGALDVADGRWPPYGSHITFELFRSKLAANEEEQEKKRIPTIEGNRTHNHHFVRMKYNGKMLSLPFCTAQTNRHHPEDPTLCTFDAFQEAIKKAIPVDLEAECKEKPVPREDKDRLI